MTWELPQNFPISERYIRSIGSNAKVSGLAPKEHVHNMLMVKTRLGLSDIAGIGLFAAEDIAKGTVTWRFMANYDRLLTDDDIRNLPEPARSNILDHTYRDGGSGYFVLCADNARFMNHADVPNTAGIHKHGAIEGYDIAVRDIGAGEELTCDYRLFDADVDKKLCGA